LLQHPHEAAEEYNREWAACHDDENENMIFDYLGFYGEGLGGVT
jgi:hypothetical protein